MLIADTLICYKLLIHLSFCLTVKHNLKHQTKSGKASHVPKSKKPAKKVRDCLHGDLCRNHKKGKCRFKHDNDDVRDASSGLPKSTVGKMNSMNLSLDSLGAKRGNRRNDTIQASNSACVHLSPKSPGPTRSDRGGGGAESNSDYDSNVNSEVQENYRTEFDLDDKVKEFCEMLGN